jgi:hypothetical protein
MGASQPYARLVRQLRSALADDNINEIDLLAYLGFDLDVFLADLGKVNPCVTVIRPSAMTGEESTGS